MALSAASINRLKAQLLTSGLSQKDQALFQIINTLIDASTQSIKDSAAAIETSSGAAGIVGAQGPQGVPGFDGVDGEDGRIGIQGPQGSVGAQGQSAILVGPPFFEYEEPVEPTIIQNRNTLNGPWIDIPFNAANFTTDSGTAWTLTSPDQLTYKMKVIDDTTIILAFEFDSTSIAAATANELRVALPTGFVVTARFDGPMFISDNGTKRVGQSLVVSGDTFVRFYNTPLTSVAWAASVNNSGVYGILPMEVRRT